jgi:hypothetical protein
MTVSTTNIPVLHSAEVAHLHPQVVSPICHGVVRTPYTSTKEARQGSTTRPFQSSTSSRKPATDSGRRNHRNPSSEKRKANMMNGFLPWFRQWTTRSSEFGGCAMEISSRWRIRRGTVNHTVFKRSPQTPQASAQRPNPHRKHNTVNTKLSLPWWFTHTATSSGCPREHDDLGWGRWGTVGRGRINILPGQELGRRPRNPKSQPPRRTQRCYCDSARDGCWRVGPWRQWHRPRAAADWTSWTADLQALLVGAGIHARETDGPCPRVGARDPLLDRAGQWMRWAEKGSFGPTMFSFFFYSLSFPNSSIQTKFNFLFWISDFTSQI